MFLNMPYKGMQMPNVTATSSRCFNLRTFKKVLFIIVSVNIHGKISVLGLLEMETYSFVLNCGIITLQSQFESSMKTIFSFL